MGQKWVNSRGLGWRKEREKMKKPDPPPEGGGPPFGARENQGPFPITIPPVTNPVGPGLETPGEGEGGFPFGLRVPLGPKTYKGAVDLSHFLKEKGGLEGMIYSQRRQDILDLWIYHTQGYFPDWQKYTPGPGNRFPLTFGWCFKLVPVDKEKVEEASEKETNNFLAPVSMHGMDDPEGEVLQWKFDSRLAFHHMAKEVHPEFYKNC
uniref:Protein Nef n=1 Tax=Human immunodeficiency virus type 1 TaxID=11676 RepID=A0A0C5KL90_HV1|nr:nef protein [Human immunodeficiency virus 1]